MKKINIGCGTDIKLGFINLDTHNKNGADFIHDLNNLPLPFNDNYFDYIYCSHVLEDFVDIVPLLSEFYRIAKKDCIIELKVPSEGCTWDSPFHKRSFNIETFNIICKGNYRYKNLNYNFKLLDSSFYGIDWLTNVNAAMLNMLSKLTSKFFVSNSPIKYLFPLVYIKARLVK